MDREKMAVLKGETTSTPKPSPTPPGNPRDRVIAVAASQIGTMEKTGKNDGEVEKYLTSVGLKKGDPYCAAFVFWVGSEAIGTANPYPKSGWSPDHLKRGSLVSKGAAGKPADTFGIYFPSKGRVAHTGFVETWGSGSVVTIEANTSPQAGSGSAKDREGDGVWRKRRLKASIYSVRDWIGP